ncbi:MAG: DNA-directed RNA polymerase subunit omega [Lachnospiraceae bacterium]
MIHPSYTELMEVVNSSVEQGEQPVVQSRYSVVLATSKRARQIIAGDEPMVKNAGNKKPLSIAVEELYDGDLKILNDDEADKLAAEAKETYDSILEEIRLEAENENASQKEDE